MFPIPFPQTSPPLPCPWATGHTSTDSIVSVFILLPLIWDLSLHTNQLKVSYKAIYQLSCILLTIPVSSARCKRAFSKLSLVKNSLRSTRRDERLSSLVNGRDKDIAKELNLQMFDVFALRPRRVNNSVIGNSHIHSV